MSVKQWKSEALKYWKLLPKKWDVKADEYWKTLKGNSIRELLNQDAERRDLELVHKGESYEKPEAVRVSRRQMWNEQGAESCTESGHLGAPHTLSEKRHSRKERLTRAKTKQSRTPQTKPNTHTRKQNNLPLGNINIAKRLIMAVGLRSGRWKQKDSESLEQSVSEDLSSLKGTLVHCGWECKLDSH